MGTQLLVKVQKYSFPFGKDPGDSFFMQGGQKKYISRTTVSTVLEIGHNNKINSHPTFSEKLMYKFFKEELESAA